MFAIPISMQRFKSIIFYQNIPKLSYFCKKKSKVFCVLRAPPPNPVPPAAGGFAPRPPSFGSWGLRPQAPKKAAPHGEILALGLAFLLLLYY